MGEDVQMASETLELLRDLDARLTQVAHSSKHWYSSAEWESVHAYTWRVEAMKLDRTADEESLIPD